jgi:hypothetical protein
MHGVVMGCPDFRNLEDFGSLDGNDVLPVIACSLRLPLSEIDFLAS